jgi:hypothetical protein
VTTGRVVSQKLPDQADGCYVSSGARIRLRSRRASQLPAYYKKPDIASDQTMFS